MITNIEAIKAKYHNVTKHIGNANNYGKILGIEVDSGNMGWYVVQRNGTLSLETYNQAQPQLFFNDSPMNVIVQSGSVLGQGSIISVTPANKQTGNPVNSPGTVMQGVLPTIPTIPLGGTSTG